MPKSASTLPYHIGVVVPARQANSHCASVGSDTLRPVLSDSHAQNFTASCQLTRVTAWFGWLAGTPRLVWSLLKICVYPLSWAGSNCAYSSFCTSLAPR